ncbi:MAG: hypothetical protein NTV01_13680, partial [Bacteroidia bacterium]|nr:hypothetical protein [Bacteroidia bacterium]
MKKNITRLVFSILLVVLGLTGGINQSLFGQTQTFTASGTFTVPAGVTSVTVQAWGGGGAGGGTTANTSYGGGGGAGGAYARKVVTVIPGNTYTVTVAATATGITGAGAQGFPSWFGTVGTVYAQGGAGGAAPNFGNVNGGTGSAAASIGDVVYAGGNGAGGTNTIGGAGGGGAGSTGTGGNAAGLTAGTGTTVGGGNGGAGRNNSGGNGNNGSTMGGGGGGAFVNDNTNRTGGSGAAGQVIVTWVCPTYSLTGTSAISTCTPPGTSIVTLSSTAAGLPVGIYTVTFDTSVPAQTGLTAIMTVTTAGSGTFTATGLTTAGNSTITVTNLSSGGCSSAISLNRTATIVVTAVPAQPSVITGPATPCIGTTATYTVTNVAGVTYNWTFPAGWTQTSGGTTNTVNVTVGATSGNVQVTPSNLCGNGTARTLAVTSSPLPQGSLTANGPFCIGGTGQLTWTATAGSGPYTIVYNDGPGNRTVGNITSGTPFNVSFNPVTTTTYILVSVTGTNGCQRTSGFTGVSATIIVYPLPQGTLTGSTICSGGTGLFTYTSTSGTGPFTLMISGQSYSGVISGVPFNAIPNPSGTTIYTLTSIIDANSCIRTAGITGASATITVNPLPQGSLSGNTVCTGGIGQFTYTSSSGTGPFTLIIDGQSYSGIVSGTSFNAIPNPSATTSYTLTSITGANSCVRTSGITGAAATITVTPGPTGVITYPAAAFCMTSTPQSVTLTGTGAYTGGFYTALPTGLTINASTGEIVPGTSTPGTYTVTYTIPASGGCPAVPVITPVTIETVTAATIATTPLNYCGTLVGGPLGGNNPSNGTGLWTQVSGPGTTLFNAPASGSSTVTASIAGTYVYQWTISNGTCAPSSAQMTVTYDAAPTAATIATSPLNICRFLMSGALGGNTPAVGTGLWTKISGPGTVTFSTPTTGTSTATVSAYGTYVFQWTISNGTCAPSSAQVTVNYYASPTTATIAVSPLNYCGTLVSGSLGGNTPAAGTGLWSKVSGPGTVTFSASTSGSSIATVSAYGAYVYQWTISSGTCTPSSAQVTVNYYASPTTATITNSPLNYCGTLVSGSLGGNTPAVGSGLWSQASGPGTTTFSASTSGTSTATSTVYGTYVYQWTISNGTCTASTAQVTVNYYATPTTAAITTSPLDYCGTLVSGSLG